MTENGLQFTMLYFEYQEECTTYLHVSYSVNKVPGDPDQAFSCFDNIFKKVKNVNF